MRIPQCRMEEGWELSQREESIENLFVISMCSCYCASIVILFTGWALMVYYFRLDFVIVMTFRQCQI